MAAESFNEVGIDSVQAIVQQLKVVNLPRVVLPQIRYSTSLQAFFSFDGLLLGASASACNEDWLALAAVTNVVLGLRLLNGDSLFLIHNSLFLKMVWFDILCI